MARATQSAPSTRKSGPGIVPSHRPKVAKASRPRSGGVRDVSSGRPGRVVKPRIKGIGGQKAPSKLGPSSGPLVRGR